MPLISRFLPALIAAATPVSPKTKVSHEKRRKAMTLTSLLVGSGEGTRADTKVRAPML